MLAACGRVGFDARTPDATSDASPCAWSAFSVPQKLPAVVQSASDDWFPAPTLQGSELYFYSYPTGHGEIFHAAAAPYGAPGEVSELAQGTNDIKWPTLTDDALVIVYGAYDGSLFHLWQATRASIADPFSNVAMLASVTSANNEYAPWLSADGLRLYFSSDRGGTPMIYETSRADRASAFAAPQPHPELQLFNAGSLTTGPTLSADGREVFYSAISGTQYDIFTAHRDALDAAFGAATLVPELSSPLDDIGMRLSLDGTTMFLNYDSVAAGGANADLWSATRACN